MNRLLRVLLPACVAALLAAAPAPVPAANLTVVYTDGAGFGFNDPGLGAQRRTAFEFALQIWGDTIFSGRDIQVSASFGSFGGDGFGAILAGAGPTFFFTDFNGAPLPNTLYTAAQAQSLDQSASVDLTPGDADIEVIINADVDGPIALGPNGFYYGLDSNPPAGDIDFIAVILHELGHGLGFLDTISPADGSFEISNIPDIYSRQLTHPGLGHLEAINNAGRLTAITSNQLFWKGPTVTAAKGGQVKMFAPGTYQPGSSVSHWDTSNSPDLLMEPIYTGPTQSVDITRDAFLDLGWQIQDVAYDLCIKDDITSDVLLVVAQPGSPDRGRWTFLPGNGGAPYFGIAKVKDRPKKMVFTTKTKSGRLNAQFFTLKLTAKMTLRDKPNKLRFKIKDPNFTDNGCFGP